MPLADGDDKIARRELLNSEQKRPVTTGITLRHYPSWIKWLCAVVTIAAGCFCSVVFKWQNKVMTKACETCEYAPFEGALYQTQVMFMGEALAIFLYYIDRSLSARANKAPLFDFAADASYYDQPEGPWWCWPICSLFDFVSTLMLMVSLKMTYASTVQMLRNLMIVVAAGLQPLILRKALRWHEIIGVLIIFAAMFLTAVPAIENPDPSVEASASETILGCVLALVGTSIQSVQLLLEEFFLRRGRSSPLRTVGLEGFGGIVWSFVAWPICQWAGMEYVTGSWYGSWHSGLLSTITIVYLPIVATFNVSGIATTFLGSALLRSVCYAVRSPLIWIISLIVKWQQYEHWSLASAIVFCFGFAAYLNALFLPHGNPIDRFLSKPVHCCGCLTNRALDEPYDREPERAGERLV